MASSTEAAAGSNERSLMALRRTICNHLLPWIVEGFYDFLASSSISMLKPHPHGQGPRITCWSADFGYFQVTSRGRVVVVRNRDTRRSRGLGFDVGIGHYTNENDCQRAIAAVRNIKYLGKRRSPPAPPPPCLFSSKSFLC